MGDPEQLSLLDSQPSKRVRAPTSERVEYEADFMRELLEDTREARGQSKADIARAMSREPAAIRRLLTAPGFNPELRTLIELADTLGMQVVLKPKRGRPKKNSG
jgi:DNA-binding phage protein